MPNRLFMILSLLAAVSILLLGAQSRIAQAQVSAEFTKAMAIDHFGPIHWCLGCPSSPERAMNIGFSVWKQSGTLEVLVRQGADNSGDQAVELKIFGPPGRTLLGNYKANSYSKWQIFRVPLKQPGEYTVMLRDADTATTGEAPGNGGSLMVRVVSGNNVVSGNQTGNWIDGFISGKLHNGKAVQGNKSWPFKIRITNFNKTTGAFVGELTWTSLGSIHLINGTLNGGKLAFKEVKAIKAGGAHLNVVYTMTTSSNNATGTWVDLGDKSKGTIAISGL